MSTELYITIAHMRLDDEAFVLVPVQRAFVDLTRTTRMEILEELRGTCRRERLQGHVVPMWFDENGRLGFLADSVFHRRLNTVTPARLRSNLNRTLMVPAPSADLRGVAGAIAELADVVVRMRPVTRPGGAEAPPVPSSGRPPETTATPEDPVGARPSPPYGAQGSFYGAPSAYTAPGRAPLTAGASAAAIGAPVPFDGGYAPRTTTGAGGLGVVWAPPPPPPALAPAPAPMAFAAPRTLSRELPRRIVTMVFTDIVGSTELKQRAGEHGAMELIRWHHATVRDVLAANGGGEEVSTAGDSFFLVFASPSDAVRFALLLQARLRRGPGNGWFVLDRIGIHVGEVFLSDEVVAGKVRDFYGVQVDTCARVMGLGNADQILLTRFATENARPALAGQSIPGLGALAWVHHGAYALKGVDGVVDVFEVGEAGVAPMTVPAAEKRVSGG